MPDAKYCPREPTPEMLRAVRNEYGAGSEMIDLAPIFWQAMYDAAPAQAEPRDVPLTPGNWPLIALGYGQVEVAEGHHDGVAALIFGRNGTGKIGEPTQPERAHLPGETLAVVTFANLESLDVVARKLATIRAKCAPSPAAQAEPREWTPPREIVKHVQPYRYEAAPSPAAQVEPLDPDESYERSILPESYRAARDEGSDYTEDEHERGVWTPSPAAEDGLVERLKKWGLHYELRAQEYAAAAPIREPSHELSQTLIGAAARIERDAQEIADIRRANRGLNAATADLQSRLIAERDAALRRAEALREALRGTAIDSAGFNAKKGYDAMMCLCCSCKWRRGAPEEHAEGCLASPAETK